MLQGQSLGVNISPKQLEDIGALALTYAGIVISPNKVAMVQSRLAKRLRQLSMSNYDEYIHYVASSEGLEERRAMISALTTNVSSFFRENHHFETLATECIPCFEKASEEETRIWSAGCSNGQEPYSIAITILENSEKLREKQYRILATDIDPTVLAHAKKAEYNISMMTGLSDTYRRKYFDQIGENIRASSDLRNMISFRELNLFSNWPISKQLDVIFCRNVMIYFDEERQRLLWEKFRNALKLEGWLFVGHSERLPPAVSQHFDRAGITAYRRVS